MGSPLMYVVVGDPDSAEAEYLRTQNDRNIVLVSMDDVPAVPALATIVARHVDPTKLTDRFVPDTKDRAGVAALKKRLGLPIVSAGPTHRFFIVGRAYFACTTVGSGVIDDSVANQSGFVLARFVDRENVSFRLWAVDIGHVNNTQTVVDVHDGNDMAMDLFPPSLFYTALSVRITGSCCR